MTRKIGHQLILAVGLVSLLVFALSAFVLVRSQHRTLISQIETQALELSETIKSSTRYAMLINRPEHVHRIIDTIGQQEGIENVRIFNKDGEIIYSSDKSLVSTMVDKRAEACYACHTADLPIDRLPIAQRTRIFETSGNARSLGVINPIYNEAGCTQADCHAHPQSQSVLGVLDVTMSLSGADRRLVAQERRVVIAVLAALLAISAILWLLVHYLVGRPVGRLLAATQAVAAGDLSYQIGVTGSNELGQLADSFNSMIRKLREAQLQILQSDKMASLGRLAAGVAHEINNPLTGVLTYSSFLLKRAPEGSEEREDLATVVRETKRCREIVQGLLDFARQVPPRKGRVDLNEIVDRSLTIVDNQLSVRNIRVTRSLEGELPPIEADPNQMVQVMVNLLVNAADAIGDSGGEIFVATRTRSVGGVRCVEIRFADSGCGISDEVRSRIFEPFFTTKGSQGTGLGLAVVWGIVEEHGGQIRIDSKPERGATFTVLFPVEGRLDDRRQ